MLTGLSAFVPGAAGLAVAMFLAGMVMMLVAVALAIAELRRALDPVELESRFVDSLTAEGRRGDHDASLRER